MSRIEDLLEQSLSTGTIPEEATAAERAELEELVPAARTLRDGRHAIDAEASRSLPIARARFERFVAANQQPVAVRAQAVSVPRRGLFSRLFDVHRGVALAGAAVAIGLLGVVALVTSQALLSNTETASAQVLFPDDYVQVQGTVQSLNGTGDARTVSLDSPAGRIDIALSGETSVVDEQTTIDPATIKVGDQLLIGGVAVDGHTVSAQTVALSRAKPAAGTPRLKLLSRLAASLEGRVSLLTISRDGTTARVAIDGVNGERYVAKVDVATAEELLRLSSTALGAIVRANAQADPKAPIRLALTSPSPSSPVPERTVTPDVTQGAPAAGTVTRPDAATVAGKASFVTVRGVVIGRNGNLLSLETARGLVTVVVRPTTRRLAGDSGLTVADLGNPDAAIGHTATVTGGLEARTGRVVADLIILGPRFR